MNDGETFEELACAYDASAAEHARQRAFHAQEVQKFERWAADCRATAALRGGERAGGRAPPPTFTASWVVDQTDVGG